MDDLTVKPQLSAVVDIEELIGCLRHERLLVGGERRSIQELNEKLASSVDELLRRAWINLQQRVNLNALVGVGRDRTEEQCCQRANSLANSFFVEAKEVLDYQVIVNYSYFLSWLRTRPELVAQWIVIGEALSQDQKTFTGILHSLVGGLYGSLQLPQDTSLMLSLLQYLARLQLVTTDNPRRLLKQGSCAFSRMYFLFHECLTSAKLFLIAALQAPILKLIANSKAFLDIDPNKTLSRLSQAERIEKFGEEGTEAYAANISHHRKWAVKTLTDLTKTFITSLQENVHCFPDTLAWLIRRIAHMIAKSFSPHSKEINGISTDLIFTLFICPAIVQPEPYGICDAPISETARHNLMQIGQIIQMLALAKFETPDERFKDLYASFDLDCVTGILDVILNSMEDAEDEIPIGAVPGVERNIALFTEQELYNLTSFLKLAQSSILQEQGNTANEAASTAGSDYCSNNGDSTVLLPNDPLVILLNKLPTENEGSPRNTLSNNTSPTHSNGAAKKTHTLLLSKAKSLTRQTLVNGDCNEQMHPTTVLVIPLHQQNEELIGLLTEEKVLAMHAIESGDPPELVDEILTNSGQEKRTRFSHADEGSIGNTSDNLEVISEAASNHSVASSIELENEDQNDMNDNLSDMVSANVSGRGTPNISGRDTPSSQVTENEDNRPLAEARQPYMPQPRPPNISKQIGSDIEDKFCKFEIKKLLEGEETISIISDTWSTDVLASDSETIDAGEPRSFPAIIEQPLLDPGLQNPLLDVSETQSESAWSTDVLASDTERLTEVDNDDIVSVAPSDDTASVARSDDAASVAPSEVDDQNLNDRRLSTASVSNHFVSFQSSQNSPSAFQEYRRIDVTVRRESMPTYITATTKTEQESQVLTYSSTVETNVLRPFSRGIGSDASKREAILLDSKAADSIQKRPILCDISNSNELPGPSKPEGTSSYVLVKQINDMQLSNTSLNSSSSGSSSNSETRNKNGVNKSWLNGSESSLSTDGNKNKVSFVRPKPAISTGAIPKSISFDMSAEKGDKDEDDTKKKGGFFGKLRMNFKHRRGKNFRSTDECSGVRFDVEDGGVKKFTEFTSSNGGVKSNDATDYNILDKYRTKQTNENGAVVNAPKGLKTPDEEESQLLIGFSVDSNLLYSDAKKKLRLVLSNTRTQHFRGRKDTKKHIKKDLESFLQIELAKAKDLSQWSTAARVAEALRCIRLLDISTFNKLCENLKGDLCTRSVYLKYLLRSKQTLLSSQEYLKELFGQVDRDQELCASFLVSVCVRVFLEKHEQEVQNFCAEFKKLTLVDEKNDLLANFLRNLFTKMRKDPLWAEGSDEQIEMAQVTIERSVMTEVYTNAIYPNGDGDRHRDSLLSSHLRKLASMISPNHKYLLINKIYQNECPWLPAQEALRAMVAYKTPRDKLRCVVRCASAIMDLLSLAQGSSATADDLVPVIVYVIIQANPPDLLSTIQYVNSFYGNLSGEDDYWWTQFCSAVEYTKTMEYTD